MAQTRVEKSPKGITNTHWNCNKHGLKFVSGTGWKLNWPQSFK